ncbi:hypothetical protein [Aquiflexum sp.]|uniref:hypothetical protein n=1 Tax=Aquiflexum sp. TaxID=1872584 RepID=UPI0035942C8A
MKNTFLFIFAFLLISIKSFGQHPFSQKTQVEFGLGISLPNLNSGQELMRSQELRNQGLSYLANAEGNHNKVGNYPRLFGFNFHVAYYKPLPKTKGLMLGAMVRNTQTGTQPVQGGYEEGYFFNFITAGLAAKFYPTENLPIYLQGDFGISAVLTKNRFLNMGNQEFFHQFGIGPGGGLGLGYPIRVNNEKGKTLDLQVGYQIIQTRVEVNGIGDDNWRFGALHFSVAYNF